MDKDIETFVQNIKGKDGEPAQSETKRRARAAVTDFKEFLAEIGKTWPDESDYADYLSRNDNTTTRQRLSFIRRYFEERSKNTVMLENEKTTVSKQKKVQISCYLERETYDTLKVLAQATSTSIGEILSNCATALAKKNIDNGVYKQATTALQALNSITLEYSAN